MWRDDPGEIEGDHGENRMNCPICEHRVNSRLIEVRFIKEGIRQYFSLNRQQIDRLLNEIPWKRGVDFIKDEGKKAAIHSTEEVDCRTVDDPTEENWDRTLLDVKLEA